MTPRRAGWLTGFAVFASMAGLDRAITIARNTAASAAVVSGGEFALSLALHVVPLAIAAGLLVACIAASGRGRRAAIVAAVCSYLAIGGWVWWHSMRSPRVPGEDPVEYALELVAAFVTIGTAFALTAAVVAWWTVRNAVGQNGAERVLALETTSLHGSRDRWGAAMRAELASIDDPVQRGRFARSAAVLAFRRGTGMWPAALAALVGMGAGVVVFSAARISFARPSARGIIGEPIMGLVVLLLVAAVIAGTLVGRSFRAGLETAVLAWLAIYVCTIAVEVPQAIAWYNDEGILLLDGEGAAGAGVDAMGAAFQPVTHYAFIFVSVSQLVVAVLAATFGAMALRVVRRFGMLHDTDARHSSG